jgi:hypothetical protein
MTAQNAVSILLKVLAKIKFDCDAMRIVLGHSCPQARRGCGTRRLTALCTRTDTCTRVYWADDTIRTRMELVQQVLVQDLGTIECDHSLLITDLLI